MRVRNLRRSAWKSIRGCAARADTEVGIVPDLGASQLCIDAILRRAVSEAYAVEVLFEDWTGDATVPKFRPARVGVSPDHGDVTAPSFQSRNP